MAQITLLDIVQDILSDADGDEVNSISATVESIQCANVVRDSFRAIIDIHDIKHHDKTIQLDATGTASPTTMTRPESLSAIQWIKYDKRATAGGAASYSDITWLSPKDFLDLTEGRSTGNSDVEQVTLSSNHIIKIKNDTDPTYWTQLEGFDDIVFDAYNKVIESNLQASKSLAYGTVEPTLALTDTAVIDLPSNLVNLIRTDAKAYFFDLFKGGATREIDRRRRNSEVRANRKRWLNKNEGRNTGPDYGRK
jgi:hypothetical protein